MGNQMNLVHLHNHSCYSALDGFGTPEQIVKRVLELGQKAIAITDHGNTYAHVPFQIAAKKFGVKPIYGIEAYIVEDSFERTRFQESLGAEGIPHITILAKTQEGYANLVRLVNHSYEHGFYYKPRIDPNVISLYSKGLIVTSGCPTAFPTRLIDQGKIDEAYAFMDMLARICEDFYVEIVAQPGYLPSEKAVSYLIEYAVKNNRKILLTGDNHFTTPNDYQTQHILTRIGVRNPFSQKAIIGIPSYQYICSDEELLTRAISMWNASPRKPYPADKIEQVFRWAIANTGRLADEIDVEIKTDFSMSFAGRKEKAAKDYTREKCIEGLKYKIGKGYLPKDREILASYVARMDEEIAILDEKQFLDYILIISEIAVREKNEGHVVVCRGSAGGCLLLYLLGASETDPIKHDLSFSRFYDRSRADMPDIDMDFERNRRTAVIEEIERQYGINNVSKIAAFTDYTLKSALIDAARMYEINRDELESALSVLADIKDEEGEKTSSTSEHSNEVLDDLYRRFPELTIANRMVGQIRNQSVNAAGLIISQTPIESVCIYRRPKTPAFLATDKVGAEAIGLLKADILSVASLDVIATAVELIKKKRPDFSLEELYNLPLDDENVFKIIEEGRVVGIFQVDGSVMKVHKKAHIGNFRELYAASALCRPGAMNFVEDYARNKFNFSSLTQALSVFSDEIKKVLEPTYAIIAYQEQVMKIAACAGFNDADVSKLRRLVAKSKDTEILPFCERLEKGLQEKQGISGASAAMLVKNIRAHGKYSFNKAHCVTYSLVSYWMMWIKTYYPHEYYNAFISLELAADAPDYILVRRLVSEAKRYGYIDLVIPLVPTCAKPVVFVDDSKLVGGFAGIHGAGKKKGAEITQRFKEKRLTPKQAELGNYLIGLTLNVAHDCTKEMGAILHWFPWFPVLSANVSTDFGIAKTKLSQYGYLSYENVKTLPYDRRPHRIFGPSEIESCTGYTKGILVAGYLTAKRRKQKTIAMRHEMYLGFLEDDLNGIEIRVTGENPELYSKYQKQAKRGDFIIVRGNIVNGNLIVKEFNVLIPSNVQIVSDFEEELWDKDED